MKALETLGKMRKKANNKGFTLVELIVVIVILAILAAILVPALLGYIDRAKGSGVLLNAKSAMTATQAEFSNLYGTAKSDEKLGSMITASGVKDRIVNTADVPDNAKFTAFTKAADAEATSKNHDAWTVGGFYYTEGTQACSYDGKSWTTGTTDEVKAPASKGATIPIKE